MKDADRNTVIPLHHPFMHFVQQRVRKQKDIRDFINSFMVTPVEIIFIIRVHPSFLSRCCLMLRDIQPQDIGIRQEFSVMLVNILQCQNECYACIQSDSKLLSGFLWPIIVKPETIK
jgi:hypothetical protein